MLNIKLDGKKEAAMNSNMTVFTGTRDNHDN